MSEIEIFQPEHLDRMALRPQEAEWMAADPKYRQKILSLAQWGTGGAIVHESKILGIIGYYELWPGHLAVWAFPSVHVKQYAMIYLRTAKRYLNVIVKTFNPARIQTEAYADELHTRWMRFLGFKNETPNGMRNFSVTQQTMNLWAWTPEEAPHGTE
jgi:hypothetical protein